MRRIYGGELPVIKKSLTWEACITERYLTTFSLSYVVAAYPLDPPLCYERFWEKNQMWLEVGREYKFYDLMIL